MYNLFTQWITIVEKMITNYAKRTSSKLIIWRILNDFEHFKIVHIYIIFVHSLIYVFHFANHFDELLPIFTSYLARIAQEAIQSLSIQFACDRNSSRASCLSFCCLINWILFVDLCRKILRDCCILKDNNTSRREGAMYHI